MTRRIAKHALWAAGVVLLVSGLILTAQTTRQLRDVSAGLLRRRIQLAALLRLESRLAPYVAARETFESVDPSSRVSFDDLLGKALPQVPPADIRNLERESVPGWMERETELTFSDIPFESLTRLVQDAENARPPWLLSKCIIRASSETAGRGQAVLRFETLERQ